MKIKLDEINTSDFFLSERKLADGYPVALIVPKKGKFAWELDEIHLRSLLCSLDGKILCSGFPKFFNYSEKKELDHITNTAILSGQVDYAEKMDGSLIIRSVINEKVNFRTRGSHFLGDFEGPVMDMINKKYPRLLDLHAFDESVSALYEYTSPENRIIISYDEPELTFLGYMLRRENRAPTFHSNKALIEDVSKRDGVRPLTFYSLPNSIDEVVKEISTWKELEGIVVWCRTEQGDRHLAKIKASEYLRLHSLRYHLSADKIRKICFAENIEQASDFKDALKDLDVDWEVMTHVHEVLDDYLDTRARARQRLHELFGQLDDENVADLPTRKRIALKLKEICGKEKRLFAIGMNYVLNDKEKLRTSVLAYELGIPTNALKTYVADANTIKDSLLSGSKQKLE